MLLFTFESHMETNIFIYEGSTEPWFILQGGDV